MRTLSISRSGSKALATGSNSKLKKDTTMKRSCSFLAPALISFAALAGCSQLPAITTPATEPVAVPTAVSTVDALTVASGGFSGRSDHVVLGNASIVGAPGSYQLVFDSAFDLDGAPDPVVGFGNDGAYDAATKIGPLSLQKGAQRYSLPASFDPASASEVYVWCEKFNVPLGVATFSSTN